MAKEYSKAFYNSNSWRKLRRYVCESRNWTCEECGSYGDQVHHIIEINPDNINNPEITLNENNLQLLCESCHNKKRRIFSDVNEELFFDANGDLHSIPPR